jgi:hypothetical protein
MAGNPEGVRSLVKYSKLPIERIKYVPDAHEGTVRSISRGILFLMAFWSGPSFKAFAKLTEVVAGIGEQLELVVADVDGPSSLYDLPEFQGKIHGVGEAAWVLRGKTVATSGLGFDPDCFEPYTRLLLAMP